MHASERPARRSAVPSRPSDETVRVAVHRVRGLVGKLDRLARSDGLTGLPNKRAWEELLDHELAVARRSGEPLPVAMLDLDRFKEYNDTHGHPAGDRLLARAALAWQGALRDTDVLARWGGDEFGLLLPRCDEREGRAVLDRLRAAFPEARFSGGSSNGIARAPKTNCSRSPTVGCTR